MRPGLPPRPCSCDACQIRREEDQADPHADFANIELRVLATHGLPDACTASMRKEFALFYGGGVERALLAGKMRGER